MIKTLYMNYYLIQPEFDKWKRAILIEWLIEYSRNFNIDDFKIRQCTIHQAIIILDKYLTEQSVKMSDLQAIALMSLLLSCKIEEIQFITIPDIVTSIYNLYSTDYLINIEKEILQKLNYKLYYDTVYQYINAYYMDNDMPYDHYYLACCLSTILLMKIDYTLIHPHIIGEKLIDFIALLQLNQSVIETVINCDIIYTYIYFSWKEYISLGYTSIREYYLNNKNFDIFSIVIPKIKSNYDIDTFQLKNHLNKLSNIKLMPVNLPNIKEYSKKIFDV